MKQDHDVRHLNIAVFARGQGELAGAESVAALDRLAGEAKGPIDTTLVHYVARGDIRVDAVAGEQVWLALTARVELPLICQRCLGVVDMPVQFDREFRFVATEEIAEVEDELSEEDVLVLARDFNLMELIEDELLMAMPVVPKHALCPEPVKLQVADTDYVEALVEKPNPFAVLEQLKLKH